MAFKSNTRPATAIYSAAIHWLKLLFALCLFSCPLLNTHAGNATQDENTLSLQQPDISHSLEKQVSDKLRSYFQAGHQQSALPLAVIDEDLIADFYQSRHYTPLWSDTDGPSIGARELLWFLQHADDIGLRPADYQLTEIEKHWNSDSAEQALQLELLLTNAFVKYCRHVYTGRFKPETLDPDWHIEDQDLDIAVLLRFIAGKKTIKHLLNQLQPQHPAYQQLVKELKRFREIEQQGGWPALPAGPILSIGMQHDQVQMLRERLLISGDLRDARFKDGDIFDYKLSQAVKRYQARHGINADGTLGARTRQSLNISVSEKINKVLINLERWRWLKRKLGERYLMVNMTGFELYLVENDIPVMTMPVIIGKQYRATPSFSSILSSLVYNPYWIIPKSILLEDMLPRALEEPGFFSRRSISVYRGWQDAQQVDPETVDWTQVNEENFPYWFRQEPGPGNALGSVKFLFPNDYDIYLHGTPQRYLFNRSVRTFSSGCIRVKDPVQLASQLLNHGSQRVKNEVREKIRRTENRKVFLPEPMPIYLVYWTAWADENGNIHFSDDVYGRDTRLTKVFDEANTL